MRDEGGGERGDAGGEKREKEKGRVGSGGGGGGNGNQRKYN